MRRRTDPLAVFRDIPIFAGCSDDDLAEIDALADGLTVKAGTQLIGQGEVGREFVLIVEGEAVVSRDGAEIARLGPGDYVGELALLTSLQRNATVTAATDMSIEVIDRRGFQSLLEKAPTLTLALLRTTASRLAELDEAQRESRDP